MVFRLEVIDFFDQSGQNVVGRVPADGTAAIQLGAQLIVQQAQEAVFFRDGKAMDVFGPGRYTLTTANVPVLTRILTIPWEKSPFQAAVYFVGKQTFVDQRWGTKTPITMRDPDFGLVRLRGFGKFAFRVVDSPLLINSLVGTRGRYTTEQVTSYLKDVIVSGLTDFLATSGIGLIDLPSKFDEVAAAARLKIADAFAKFGLELTDFIINSITPPEEVEKAIDARAGMTVLGDLKSYTLYQAANSMAAAGQNPGVGSGLGFGMGMAFPAALQQAFQPASPAGPAVPVQAAPVAAQIAAAQPVAATAPRLNLNALESAAASKNDIRAIVRSVATTSKWSLKEQGDQWSMVVPVGSLRKQTVYATFGRKDDDGHELICFWSPCGPANPSNAVTLLRFNHQTLHGAFAFQPSEHGGEELVLRSNLLADTTDALEVVRVVSAIAFQADEVEQQLTGSDEL
jgi:membrane protease subunit (stomatin/prohibitin family)